MPRAKSIDSLPEGQLMRHCLVLCGAAALFLSPVLVESLRRPGAAAPTTATSGCAGWRPGRTRWYARHTPPGGRGRQAGPPAGPTPRNADGRAIFSTPGKKGVWLPGGGGAAAPNATGPQIPFQPWARAVYADRGENQLEPHTRCKPSGGVRQFLTPYGVEFVELPELQKIFIFDIGGPHTYRTDLHGWPLASGESHADLLRPLDRLVGG